MHTSASYEQSGRDLVCFPSPHVTLHSAHDAHSSNGADVISVVVVSVVVSGAVVAGGSLVDNAAVVDESVVTSGNVDGGVLGTNDDTSKLVVVSVSLKHSLISSEKAWQESDFIRDSNVSAYSPKSPSTLISMVIPS